jgi:chromosome segregation ATPase
MFLKRLEINGFKSFASKTVFDFPTGVAGIVGPNGSGKSNVIDAVRWLLGEREAKNLRGGKIEDLIFAGTPKKPRLSQASVSLVFDNTDGRLPVDFQEVVITRRVSRTGISEYFINDAEVRLKDVIDFFSKIKLGTKGLTIIGQGAGDIFVRASAQERMLMVQEILGLREYELKKHEAQRKLKNTHINLEKVQAMLEEVAPRLRMLKRQTAKWHKRSEIEEELKKVEKEFFTYKIRQLEEERARIAAPVPGLEQQARELEKERVRLEQELAKLEETASSKSRMQELSRRRRELFEEQAKHEREFMRLEMEEERYIKISKFQHIDISADAAAETLTHAKSELELLLSFQSLQDVFSAIKKLLERIDSVLKPVPAQAPEEKRDFTKQKAELQGFLEKVRAEMKVIEQEEEKVSRGMEQFNEQFKKVYGELDSVRAHIKQVSDERTKISFEKEKNEYKTQELRNYAHSLGADFHTFEQSAHSASSDVQLSESHVSDLDRQMVRLRGEIASIGDIDETLLKESEEVEAHYNYLLKESDDLSKASADLFLLIDELQEKIETDFQKAFRKVNEEFNTYFRLMFGGGSAKMKLVKREKGSGVSLPAQAGGQSAETEGTEVELPEETKEELTAGIDIELSIPQKKITSLEMLSGGEKSLTSLAVLFALISVSPPPFLVLDEVDSALDEKNSKRFSDLIGNFSKHTQFIIVTHNRVTMEAADLLYGVTMDEGGGSKVISLKLEDAKPLVR